MHFTLLVAGIALLPPAPADTTTVYARMGRDTVAIEQFVRSRDRLEGILITRTPRTSMTRYVAELASDGTIRTVRVEPLRADHSPLTPARYQEVTFLADTAVFRGVRGDSITRRTILTPAGTVPFAHPFFSYGFYDQALRQSVRHAGDSIPVLLYQVGAAGAASATFVREGSNGFRMTWRGVGTVHFSYGPDGGLTGSNSLETTFKTEAATGPSVDMFRLAAEYARRDTAGVGLGVLSPRDTVRASVEAATLSIDYSRPAMRGRRIFGALVPYGEVWRAGADAATMFRTDHDLKAGAITIPAGAYTLWIVPTAAGDTLLINRQTGQWGTQHDPAQDFLRIPITRSSTGAPVERFTIELVNAMKGSVLQFEWETTRLSLPITVP